MNPTRSFPGRRMPLMACALSFAIVAPLAADDKGAAKPKPAPTCPPFFQKLPPLGAETPREVARRFWNGIAQGQREQVLSCFELNSAESLATAFSYAQAGELLAKTAKLHDHVQKRFGQSGIDTVRGELGVELQKAEFSKQDFDKNLAKLEVVTEGDKSIARMPNPLGKQRSLRMHKFEGRWYLSAESAASDATMFIAAATVDQMVKIVQQADEAVTQGDSLKQFQQKLKEINAKYRISPASTLETDNRPDAATDKSAQAAANKLPAGKFRITVHNRLDPSAAEAIVQDLFIETAQPADLTLMLKGPETGSGRSWKIDKHAGQAFAKLHVQVLIDYLKRDNDHFDGNYFKVGTFVPGQSGGYLYSKAPSIDFSRSLRLPVKQGVYPYAKTDDSDGGLELLSIGDYRLIIRVTEPKKKD